MIPSKKDPNLPEYIHQLQTLNRFSNFIRQSEALTTTLKEDAYKVIDCLKFIKLNLDFIGYAVEHRSDDALYTYTQDKSKGVIRDFNNTAMHFNSYSSTALVQAGLKNLVEQFEQAIETMQEKGELDAFAKKLQFDGDIGCIEARTAAALSFAATRLSRVVHSLDDQMEAFYSILQNEDDPKVIVNKAIDFFKPWMGQEVIWENNEYVIDSALIKRYLAEILTVDLPIVTILDELKKKESNPHYLALIKSINPQALTQTLLTHQHGLEFLSTVSLHQPSIVVLALLQQIENETIKKLFNKNLPFVNAEFLNLLLKKHSAVVCETLLEKLHEEAETNHFNTYFKEILLQCFKTAIQPQSFFIFEEIESAINFLTKYPIRFGIFCLIGLSFIIILALSAIGIAIAAPILACITVLSLGSFPIVGAFFTITFTAILMMLPVLIVMDFTRVFIYTPINAWYKTHHLIQNLLNDVLASQSTRLLALFFSHLSPQQIEALNLPLIKLQERLPNLLFASNLSVSPEIEDTFYRYCYSNSTLRTLLLENNSPLLAQCIDDYFEGKLPKPSIKIILLFEECLTEIAKKQILSDKEHAFLEDIKQEDRPLPQKSLEDIWLSGVESWSYYRYLRQKDDLSTQILLDRLLLKNELFGGGWSNENFTSFLGNFLLKQQGDLQTLETAKSCIAANTGLAKVITPNHWGFFMQQLENLNYREPSLRRSVTVTNETVKLVHLTNEVVPYLKDRHPKPKTHYSHTKKTSTTLLSSKLITPLICSNGALLFDRRQCQVKALLLRNASTYEHEWVGEKASVYDYQESIRGSNETNEAQFIAKIQTRFTMNEVLAKLNKTALRAIIIQNDSPEERLQATQRRDEIESKFSIRLPILFYKPAPNFEDGQNLETYTLKEQERDQYHHERDCIRGNRLWINP